MLDLLGFRTTVSNPRTFCLLITEMHALDSPTGKLEQGRDRWGRKVAFAYERSVYICPPCIYVFGIRRKTHVAEQPLGVIL